MPIGTSPFRSKSRGPTRDSPSPPPLPPKHAGSKHVIDLNSSTGSFDRNTGSKVTRRAVLCDIVVERHGEETTNLLSQLGHTLEATTAYSQQRSTLSTTTKSTEGGPTSWDPTRRDEMDTRLRSLIEELVRTERSYHARISALKVSYADKLRHYAKNDATLIISTYHNKVLFGNIDAVHAATELFIRDVEEMWTSGQAPEIIGDVCLRHLKQLKTFDPYRTYIGNQDESQKLFQEMLKKHPRFVQYMDMTKYSTNGIGNIGLRELLMEPVQRIPRYTLLWQAMTKCMPPLSEQRSKLLESIEIASRIARCDTDEQTVRATVMYCLQQNIDGIPASLFSNHRNYIDSIDTEELFPDTSTTRTPGSNLGGLASPTADGALPPLRCTLFLFDDQLVIAKRPSAAISGRKLTGLDDIAKLVKSGGGVAVKEKDGAKKERLSYRGSIDIMQVTGLDRGAGDFQLVFETNSTPLFADQSDRWAGRPLRSYSAVQPPHPPGFEPATLRNDKLRFLNNLWEVQALSRTRPRHKMVEPVCRALASDDEVDINAELMRVKTYWDLWDRAGWTATDRKGKIVVQLTEDEDTPELSLPQEGGPTLIIRLEAMPGAVCKLQAMTNAGTQVLRTATSIAEVNEKIVEAITASGLFQLRLPKTMMTLPGTPTSSSSLFSKRATRLGTDIARNLWGNSASSRGGSSSDAFGSTSTKQTHSSIKSRSSTLEVFSKAPEMLSVTTGGQANIPKSPHSPRSPASQAASPISIVEVASPTTPQKEPPSPMRWPKSPAATTVGSPATSRVAAMRQQLERKLHENTEETLAPSKSPVRRGTSPAPVAEAKARSRVPVPMLAARLNEAEGSLSRDSSLSSFPPSPTKGAGLSRTATLSPRGPRHRGQALTSGYVPPLPPPTPTAGGRSLPMPPSIAPVWYATSNLGHGSQPSSREPSDLGQAPAAQNLLAVVEDGPTTLSSQVSHSGHSSVEQAVEQTLSQDVDLTSETHGSTEDLDEELGGSSPLPQENAIEKKPSGIPARLGLGAPPRVRLTDDENTPPSGVKRVLESSDQLSPRKRSSSGNSSTIARVDSGSKSLAPRRASGKATPRSRLSSVSKAVLTPARQVSAMSTGSLHSLASAIDEVDIVMSDHADIHTAFDSTRLHIADARKLARRVRMDALAMRKLRAASASTAALPRSPQTRNIHSVLSAEEEEFLKVDTPDLDDLARHICLEGELLETQLASALADSERARMLARRAAEATGQYEATITTMEGQLGHAREREELLQEQLRRRDIELEEIYNAFNVELDGMYNDVNLPSPEEVQAALRKDLQEAKARRNEAELENHRLKLELEEEKLKREQWSQLLQARGLIQ